MPSYVPRCKVRLTIRLDEFGRTDLVPKAPAIATNRIDGVKVDRGDLQVVPDPSRPGQNVWLLLPPGVDPLPGTSPQEQARSGDGLTFDLETIPAELEWSQNGFRAADQLTCVIRFVDAPLDPRLVRACAVTAVIGTISEDDAARDVAGEQLPYFALPEQYADPAGTARTNVRFLGWVDKWNVEWTDDGEPSIHLECRDNSQLLLNQEAGSKHVLDMSKPIDEAVAQYLGHFPQMAGMSVEYLPPGDPVPVLDKVLAETAFRPDLGPQQSKGGGGNTKMSVMDYFVDVLGAIGHSIRVDGTRIILQRPRSFSTSSATRRQDDPFQGRTVDGQSFDYRRMIWGHNVQTMHMSRNYAKHAVTNVECRCWVGEAKTLLVARFPEEADEQVYALPGDRATDKKWTVYRVAGITDKGILKGIAKSYYEQIGRNELGVEITTTDLSSFGGGNLDPDVLDMKPGDTFEVLVRRDQDDTFASLTRAEHSLSFREKGKALMQHLGFSAEFAAAYAKAYTDASFLTTYRTKQMRLKWDSESGIGLTIVGMNYTEIRANKYLPPSSDNPDAPPDPQSPSTMSEPGNSDLGSSGPLPSPLGNI